MSLVWLSSANCLWTFLCMIFRRGFLLGQQPCRPIWCSVRRMVWALTGWPPTPSTSAAMLAALIRLFPKHNLWIWRWAHALNFFVQPWWGLFWVEPVLLNCCMVLATMLQLSFRVLAIFLEEEESFFICHIHNYTEYNQQWNVFSAFNPSKCPHTWSSGQPSGFMTSVDMRTCMLCKYFLVLRNSVFVHFI